MTEIMLRIANGNGDDQGSVGSDDNDGDGENNGDVETDNK